MHKLTWPHDAFLQNGVLTAGRFHSPGPPSWSPNGRFVSYVHAKLGQNQLWQQPLDGSPATPIAPHPVLGEATDGTDRRDVGGGPQWSPDGTRIAYVSRNEKRGAGSSIFVANTLTGQHQQLTDHPANDRTPRWSPDGTQIAFVVDWDNGCEEIAIVDAAGSTPIQLTYDRHANTDIFWSPDGQTIAFASQRSDEHLFAHAIGLVDVKTAVITLVEHPPAANERMPRFSPDGQTLAYVSDRDSWDSLWLCDMDTLTPRKIPFEQGEVAHPVWSPDGKRIAFTLTNGVWRRLGCVTLATGDVTWWSPEAGCAYWPAWNKNGRYLAYAYTNATTPRDIWVVDTTTNATRQLTHTAPATFPQQKLIAPKRLSYKGHEGLAIDALLYEPPPDNKTGAGILYVHGGPNGFSRDVCDPMLQYLVVEQGFTILAPNVRGSLGYGRFFMDMNTHDYGGKDRLDWIAGCEILIANGVEQQKIAIWGRSYGGFATMLSLCLHPDLFCGGIAQFGVSDWHKLWDGSIPWVRRLLAHQLGQPTRDATRYRERSPIHHANKLRAPILLLHGLADAGVPPDQSTDFATALAANNQLHELHLYPNEGHGFDEPRYMIDAARRITAFLLACID